MKNNFDIFHTVLIVQLKKYLVDAFNLYKKIGKLIYDDCEWYHDFINFNLNSNIYHFIDTTFYSKIEEFAPFHFKQLEECVYHSHKYYYTVDEATTMRMNLIILSKEAQIKQLMIQYIYNYVCNNINFQDFKNLLYDSEVYIEEFITGENIELK